MYRILITGKNSYIGTSVEKYLLNFRDGFQITRVTTKDHQWKKEIFRNYDVVFHVAGIAHSTPKAEQRDLYYRVNTDLSIEVARFAKEAGVKQFIFMSSAIVYTDSQINDGKITKETVPYSKNFYGDSKIRAEKGLLDLEDSSFKVVILRPPMIYGPGSKGNFPKLESLANSVPIFPRINNKRSMLYIDNLSEFIRLIIINNEDGIFFPQNSQYSSTSEIVRLIRERNGKKVVLVPFLGRIAKLFKFASPIDKLFGDYYYESNLSEYKESYALVTLEESIKKMSKV